MSIGRIAGNVGNTIVKGAGTALNKVASSKIVSTKLTQAVEDPAKFAAGMALFSFVSKDAINCLVYTYKSWNNEKLENPKFMALMDAVQGVLNVTLQTFVGKKILEGKLTPFLKSKATGKQETGKFVDALEKSKASKIADKLGLPKLSESLKNVCSKFRQDGAKEVDNILDVKFDKRPLHDKRVGDNLQTVLSNMKSKLNINFDKASIENVATQAKKHVADGCKKNYTKGLGLIVTILGTTALLKRTLIPFISTPMAAFLEEKMKESDAKKAAKVVA